MGLRYADIELINFADETLCEDGYLPREKVRSTIIKAVADTGVIRMTINENIRHQLGLRIRSSKDVTLADGTKKNLQVAGPIRLKFKSRDCIMDALVLPDNEVPLLGAVPMELMDLVIILSEQSVEYNPKHPNGQIFSFK
jgi:clan AA aspartic protease